MNQRFQTFGLLAVILIVVIALFAFPFPGGIQSSLLDVPSARILLSQTFDETLGSWSHQADLALEPTEEGFVTVTTTEEQELYSNLLTSTLSDYSELSVQIDFESESNLPLSLLLLSSNGEVLFQQQLQEDRKTIATVSLPLESAVILSQQEQLVVALRLPAGDTITLKRLVIGQLP